MDEAQGSIDRDEVHQAIRERELNPDTTTRMRHRVITVPLIRNAEDAILICRMPAHRGAYPGQWGLPGGGLEPGERMEEALRRETREELGLELSAVEPLLFKDAVREKLYPDGTTESVYMIFLVFSCRAADSAARLNDEFDAYAWVLPTELSGYDLNEATLDTLQRAGLMTAPVVRDQST
jgi:nucleoside triphosphatase